MMTPQEKHVLAMNNAEQAVLAKQLGQEVKARRLFRKAFDFERDVAIQAHLREEPEPIRSILLRSAATLALDCGEFREAERLIGMGLAGSPPNSLAEEFRCIFENIIKEQ